MYTLAEVSIIVAKEEPFVKFLSMNQTGFFLIYNLQSTKSSGIEL
jgi:hypothetical protein